MVPDIKTLTITLMYGIGEGVVSMDQNRELRKLPTKNMLNLSVTKDQMQYNRRKMVFQ